MPFWHQSHCTRSPSLCGTHGTFNWFLQTRMLKLGLGHHKCVELHHHVDKCVTVWPLVERMGLHHEGVRQQESTLLFLYTSLGRNLIHPFFFYRWSLSKLPSVKAGCQLITGKTYKDRQLFTPEANLELPIRLTPKVPRVQPVGRGLGTWREQRWWPLWDSILEPMCREATVLTPIQVNPFFV